MKKSAKALLLSLCAVLLVAASVMGTLAYLTSTDTVKNTFTVGRVSISLDEAKVNDNGQPVNENNEVVTELDDAERVKGNTYHLLPGHVYTKDPTVHINPKSESAYYRMIVTVTFDNAISDENLATKLDGSFTGYDVSKWALGGSMKTVSADKKTITYEYRYHTTVANATDAVKDLEPLFTKIEVPGSLTNEELAAFTGMKINIVAHAIQEDGFATADAAWAAFDTQHSAE